ncbi:MAG TPA: sulfatase-like hydrolase/transferase, partial [Gemmatimonadales bacterium]
FKKGGKRFAAAIMPQLGHAPWPDVRGMGDDHPARGRALMAIQDAWIGEILDVLRATSSLDTTLIVVTSDHGIRTRAEDPGFKGGRISDYSFHVPLLVYAPTALRAPMKISWLTSHVDIAPTVLDLLGVKRRQESEQGTPIWDGRLPDRTTFLLARGYLGADAYHSRGEFYALNRLSDAVHRSRTLDFPPATLLEPGSPDHAAVIQRLDVMERLQRRWLSLAPPPD